MLQQDGCFCVFGILVQNKLNVTCQIEREGNCLLLFTKERRLRGLNQSGSDKDRLKRRHVSAATKSRGGSISVGIVSHVQSFSINNNTTHGPCASSHLR